MFVESFLTLRRRHAGVEGEGEEIGTSSGLMGSQAVAEGDDDGEATPWPCAMTSIRVPTTLILRVLTLREEEREAEEEGSTVITRI
ncbi:unnamed protein product [Closterium sp. Naga37s-1]|nr:unnamed protein product [Closterium sp. Naga37s-1]